MVAPTTWPGVGLCRRLTAHSRTSTAACVFFARKMTTAPNNWP